MFDYSHARWIARLRWKLGYFRRKRALRLQKELEYGGIRYESRNYPNSSVNCHRSHLDY